MEPTQKYSIKAFAAFVLVILTMSGSALAQKAAKSTKPPKPAAESPEPDPDKGLKPPSGPSFYIASIEGSKGMFSVLLGNGNTTVAGSFTERQIEVFEAVLVAAKEFAQTDEAVGKSAPITTRLMDQHEWSLFVDVSKVGDRSKLYVTLITPDGKLTAEAGEIVRGSKKEPSALLLKMLSQVQEAKTAAPRP
ncbi:MAG TPA: hypothetical protein VLM38_18820 [Blastocatellia bacterium]|nr:hypothetical protein [Blastocatellia bacterium]